MQDKVDYIIVGLGIAGTCFARQCLEHGKSFRIITDFESSASHVAAGLFNPIVIKRFNPVWRFQHQMQLLQETFSAFEDLLGGNYLHYPPVYRIFSNEQEIVTWKEKITSMESLQFYLNPTPIETKVDQIYSPYGFGEVKGTGWVDLAAVLYDFSNKFQEYIIQNSFDYAQLDVSEGVRYRELKADKIIFAEGVKVLNNPFFNFIPIRPNKGETLIIETHTELPNVTFNSKNFLMPIGDKRYYVGSTYDREWDDAGPTEENKQKLIKQLKFYFKGDFNILEHRAAFRPTTPNMRPILGSHPTLPHMYVLNGLGTRGTFNGPDMARELFEFLEDEKPLDKEIDVKRYYKLLKN
ncbi:MAG: NAD(P)/FAD-dependent oxidoreductase [Weeksellaceae bacterium]